MQHARNGGECDRKGCEKSLLKSVKAEEGNVRSRGQRDRKEEEKERLRREKKEENEKD